ncbi:glycoside hydrolase family 25 protein [Flavobacterium sp. SE-1-e]|uniref:Glycoside hydrolase family 25 protein n=2 Tax=Flavobacterium agrisoli TaxID=2793066 RepID=A0A934PM61_9FLAO|nr:glycoside hydrolase family 25 protein [Flavobacterium agrisoli]MBK0370736.1 glycoside hydrolase family 25 protein [Flavobacterium agrisoli]
MRKSPKRKTTYKRSAKSNSSSLKRLFQRFLLLFFLGCFVFVLYHFRSGLAYYFSFKTDKTLVGEEKRISDVRNIQVIENHKGKVLGIDVSEFQEKIDWDLVETVEETYPIHFVFVRATAGCDRLDRRFKRNWKAVQDRKLIRGAYHYYRPNENSIQQAAFFIQHVHLEKGDLPPVLDIEKLPKTQSIDSLKVGLHRWLDKVEAHYKVRPIIYSGERYYDDFLKEEFSDYVFWIANYNFYREKMDSDWLFWQFTEKASVTGIPRLVDVNVYNGDLQQLQFITVD